MQPKLTAMETALVFEATRLLGLHYKPNAGDNAAWNEMAGSLAVLGAERCNMSANTEASCRVLLAQFEAGRVAADVLADLSSEVPIISARVKHVEDEIDEAETQRLVREFFEHYMSDGEEQQGKQ